MTIIERIKRKALRTVSSNVPVKPFRMKSGQPVISFTFDDFPQTAAKVGGKILEKYEVAGTFYICGGLTDEYEAEMLCHSEQDLLDLIKAGHEIGSHLFHHKNCEDLSKEELVQEIALNGQYFKKLQDDRRLLNFAYPFGGTTLAARRIAANKYVTARGIRPGVNSGVVDFSNLRANSI